MKLKHAFVETKISEWNELFLLNQKFMSNFIFRGQGNSNWQLKTSLERLIENHHPSPLRDDFLAYIYETEMLKEFKWKYPSYEKNLIPQEYEYIEWHFYNAALWQPNSYVGFHLFNVCCFVYGNG